MTTGIKSDWSKFPTKSVPQKETSEAKNNQPSKTINCVSFTSPNKIVRTKKKPLAFLYSQLRNKCITMNAPRVITRSSKVLVLENVLCD